VFDRYGRTGSNIVYGMSLVRFEISITRNEDQIQFQKKEGILNINQNQIRSKSGKFQSGILVSLEGVEQTRMEQNVPI